MNKMETSFFFDNKYTVMNLRPPATAIPTSMNPNCVNLNDIYYFFIKLTSLEFIFI